MSDEINETGKHSTIWFPTINHEPFKNHCQILICVKHVIICYPPIWLQLIFLCIITLNRGIDAELDTNQTWYVASFIYPYTTTNKDQLDRCWIPLGFQVGPVYVGVVIKYFIDKEIMGSKVHPGDYLPTSRLNIICAVTLIPVIECRSNCLQVDKIKWV